MNLMRRIIGSFSRLPAVVAALYCLLSPFQARAFHYSFDGTLGASFASKAGGYMVGTQEPPLGSGIGFPFALTAVIGVGNPQAALSLFLGGAYRFAAYSKGSFSYNMQAL